MKHSGASVFTMILPQPEIRALSYVQGFASPVLFPSYASQHRPGMSNWLVVQRQVHAPRRLQMMEQ